MDNVQDSLIALQHEIYLEARSNRGVLQQVIGWIVDSRNLNAAWCRVAESDGAKTPGPDGSTVRDLLPRRGKVLREIASRINRGTFRPAPPRIVDVPKASGGTRQLGILNVRDRLVHAALKQVLEPILEPHFSADSFGFRPGRSVPSALVHATKLLSTARPPFQFFVKLDVDSCFDTIDHQLLLQQLSSFIADADFTALVQSILSSSGSQVGFAWARRTRGLVQGSALSPLLCNLYLNYVDQQLAELRTNSDHGIRALRYADDLLILAASQKLARQSIDTCRRALTNLRQRVQSSKHSVVPVDQGIRWLGVNLLPRVDGLGNRCDFAYAVPAEKVEQMLQRIAEMTIPPSTRIDPAAFDLGRWLKSINDHLRDWWHIYMYADNCQKVFRTLDDFADERVGLLLETVTGNRRRVVNENFRIRLPRGFNSWQVAGTRLTVLSSLAPRNPDRLWHRPKWMRANRPDMTQRGIVNFPSD